uniref:NADH dehydrogenase subunit 6 n=1 Tax=Spathius agrili TaxID=314331 RepID=D8KZU5_SPAAG|nr:NADH dehydrogenase subunit 6 [Spathius agrili]ACJ06264.1 NADH dehydrogenase subunit 6 [Spathius agrili]
MMTYYSIYMIFLYLMDMMLMLVMLYPSNLFKFHPLVLSILLIFYVMILSFKMNFVAGYYWYSYILFLVMIGGLMILFMYFTSLSNNQLFYFDKNYYKYLYVKIFILMMLMLMFFKKFDYMELLYWFNYSEIFEFLNIFEFFKKDYYKNLMINYSMDLNMFMIMYLFFTMICCVLICLKFSIPLRQIVKSK